MMKKLMYLMLLLLTFGCQVEEMEQENVSVLENGEFMLLDSPVQDMEWAGQEYAVQERDGLYIHQGDIAIPKTSPIRVLQPDEKAPQKAATRISGFWEDNTVPYTFETNMRYYHKQEVLNAIDWFHNNTDLKFVERTTEKDYVHFFYGRGCWSYVGKIGGRQEISVGTEIHGCMLGSIKHEIMHALGFWHEQSRHDRDEYIDIHWENIVEGGEHNFHKYPYYDGQDIGNELDYWSIMMYGSLALSKNGLPTITKKDGSSLPYNRVAPSALDKYAINTLYPLTQEPEYINGERYVIAGLTVLRHNDQWWYYSRTYGWKQVELRDNGYWYYVR